MLPVPLYRPPGGAAETETRKGYFLKTLRVFLCRSKDLRTMLLKICAVFKREKLGGPLLEAICRFCGRPYETLRPNAGMEFLRPRGKGEGNEKENSWARDIAGQRNCMEARPIG